MRQNLSFQKDSGVLVLNVCVHTQVIILFSVFTGKCRIDFLNCAEGVAFPGGEELGKRR